MNKDFFPPKPNINPTIYTYELSGVETHQGLLKVGYTVRTAQERVEEQMKTSRVPYRIVLEESAVRDDGTSFTDHEIHKYLLKRGFTRYDGEWFECKEEDVRSAIQNVRDRTFQDESRHLDFGLRPEQKAAIEKTAEYFERSFQDDPEHPPHFLWNAKMRFGKTFTSYQLARKMGWTRLLILTFKPAVENAWKDDLMSHKDFEGWQFVSASEDTMWHKDIDESKPFVCFGSFQNYLGKNSSTGGIKTKNEWVHDTQWDCVILDEYHYGAWREKSKELFDSEDREEQKYGEGEYIDDFDEKILPIPTRAFLYLSGTPFRAISSGEFIEEQIFNWTYSDEQRAKLNWESQHGKNPYESLPRMVMMTYQLPDSINEVAMQGEFNEFDLNVFFTAKGVGDEAVFEHEEEVQKWLDLIRGSLMETSVDNLKLGAKKPPMPFSDTRLLRVLNHTLWYLPSVAACYAMKNLLGQPQNAFYHYYEVIVAAGKHAGVGKKALPPVEKAMRDPLESKTITLSCGKLLTGVTVKPWTGIFMLKSLSTPETYFQAAFRVQSPWTIKNPDDKSPNSEIIIKQECYVFDFAPNRALRQIADYGGRLNINETNPEKKIAEFIEFLPVLAYDGSAMKTIDAAGILDMAMSGTTATLLARRWESALLVNVDNNTLKKLMGNDEAMRALMGIEGFRSLNQDIETIINKSEAVEKVKKEKNDEQITEKEKKQLSEDEKEFKGKRKQIQEKLIKFATRIPVFMYLTDYRERALKDVITQLEPGLFQKVTGLTKEDFGLLVSLGVFNSALMNDAIFKFKRYEDASLEYTGINKHEGESIGGWDTSISPSEYKATYVYEDSGLYEEVENRR
jgi:hypothetical protein